MTTRLRQPRNAWLELLVVVTIFTGCQDFNPGLDYYHPSMERPAPSALEPPRELSKTSLPSYRIEPPDVIQLQILKMVPLTPYRIQVYDVLQIGVPRTLPDQPIQGLYLVEAEGTVDLGLAYGSVRVAGLTVDEAREMVQRHLTQVLAAPEVVLQITQIADVQPVTGTYLVTPDGTINLLKYGSVRVAGMTIYEAKAAVERQLAAFFEMPEVWVDVLAYNSKVYYIVTEGAHLGDNVVRVPVTGNETVLDAITQIQGLSQISSKEIWIARPVPGGFGCEQILPVDWVAVTRGGSTATNYQILPGDRVFIAEDKTVALTNYLGKVLGPFERVLGFGSLAASTIRGFNNLNTQTGVGF